MTKSDIRNNVIAKARLLYIPKITNNISVALELFLKNNATSDEMIPLKVSSEARPKNWVDAIGRPKCPKCDRDLLFNISKSLWQCDLCNFKMDIAIKDCPLCNSKMIVSPVNVSRCTVVDSIYNSVWTCKNKDCMETIYSKETIQEIITKEGLDGIS